ncbi:MAG TPA: sulfatase-like hydrolase/transferase [Solimonas sp.]|nr:sulfatase-like hydrolase/transferase [Solimonas sp.]
MPSLLARTPPLAAAVPRPRLGWLADAVLGLAAAFALQRALQFSDDAVCAVINLGLFAAPLLLMLVLSGRVRVALATATLFTVLLWGLGELKREYFGERLALLDFLFLSEPANWGIVERYPLLQAASAGYLALALLLLVPALGSLRGAPVATPFRVLAGGLLVAWGTFAWQHRHQHDWEVFRDDAECGPLKTCGVMSRLLFSYNVFEQPPARPGGDPSRFAALLAARPAPGVRPAAARPDVVLWLHESSFDPRQYRIDGARWPALPMYEPGPQTWAHGALRVHTYGGKTWLSEFSALTGLLPDDFGPRRSTVFNSVAPYTRDNLVRRFRDSGYRTVVLMPTPKRFYGAARSYAGLGFDRVMTLRDFPEYETVRGDEWDIATSARLAEAATLLLRAHATGPERERPLFLYLLSVHEHSPYPRSTPVLPALQPASLRRSLKARLSNYLDKLQRLDQAQTRLDAFLRDFPRPAIWAWFGDHQAYFEEAQPPYRSTLPAPDHLTQYQVRSNRRRPAGLDAPPLLDLALLPSLLADGAGLAPSPYFEGLSAMRQACDGRLEDCADAALVTSYKAWVFAPERGLLPP